jgi:hypothetical protein
MSEMIRLLGPELVMVYKAALRGKRIVSVRMQPLPSRHTRLAPVLVKADRKQLLYSLPPLLPLAAFAWCIWAMSLPPSQADMSRGDETGYVGLGNIGLMDLVDVKKRKGGWVACESRYGCFVRNGWLLLRIGFGVDSHDLGLL